MIGSFGQSLARRQFAVIATTLSLLGILLGIGGAWFINNHVERTSDRILGASVRSILDTVAYEDGNVTLEIPPGALSMLEGNARDNIYYAISVGRKPLTGYADFPAAPMTELNAEAPTFRNARFHGYEVRVASMRIALPRVREPVIVQVAETLAERRSQIGRMLAGLVLLELILIIWTAIMIRPAVKWGMRPLLGLRKQMSERPKERLDFTPLDTANVPRELKELIEGFNMLLGRLEKAAGLMQQFTADASHQMRTPLAIARMHLDVAKRHGADTATGKASITDVEDAITRLERLLSQLISLARADDEHHPQEANTSFDLTELVAECCRNLAPKAIGKGIVLHFERDAPIPMLSRPTLLTEILSNLIDNAISYNHAGGNIWIGCKKRAATVAITIEDDGPGIPRRNREEVFQRFGRLKRDQNRPGSGLGLPIVKALADHLEATIHLADGHGGKGLKAVLTLNAHP